MLERDKVQEALEDFAKRVVSKAKANLTRMGKRNRNVLYKSLGYDLDVGKNSFSLSFETPPMLEYGIFVDSGVSGKKRKYNTPYSFKNKMPPRKPILDWVNSKRLRLRDKETGKFKKGGQNSLAFLIQRHIYNEGLKPSLFFTKPFKSAFKDLPDELAVAYGLDVEDFIKYTFNGTNK